MNYFIVEYRTGGQWRFFCGLEASGVRVALNQAAEAIHIWCPVMEPADWRVKPSTKEAIDGAEAIRDAMDGRR